MLEAIVFDRSQMHLKVLDQLKLPTEHVFLEVKDCQDAWNVIRNMNVRGAPAIAIVASLGLAVQVSRNTNEESTKSFSDFVVNQLRFLGSSRPTAVNLHNATRQIEELVVLMAAKKDTTVAAMKTAIVDFADDLLKRDIEINKSLSKFGGNDIMERNKTGDGKLKILTHCNTGSLATAGYGTALGVIRYLWENSKLETAYFTETRPYNQGSRLTSYELAFEKINACFICDSMAAALMREKEISAVVVGVDRMTLNGDFANKIGTLSLAIAAKHFGVPFYVACPTNTIDWNLNDGSKIQIEFRKDEEMVQRVNGKRIPPEGIKCWNPAFDVTPYDLVTGGIITEHGMVTPPLNSEENKALLLGKGS